jgi:hypothetical protein
MNVVKSGLLGVVFFLCCLFSISAGIYTLRSSQQTAVASTARLSDAEQLIDELRGTVGSIAEYAQRSYELSERIVDSVNGANTDLDSARAFSREAVDINQRVRLQLETLRDTLETMESSYDSAVGAFGVNDNRHDSTLNVQSLNINASMSSEMEVTH